MDESSVRLPAAMDGYSTYDLRSVERFLLEVCEERGRVMEEIATVRRKIADAEAQLTNSAESELRLTRMVIDAQRVVRGERRAHERAVASIRAEGEAQAERVMVAAREQVAAMRASLRGMERSAPDARPASGSDAQVTR